MTDPDPRVRRASAPPLHEMDGYHALTIQQIHSWIDNVYPTTIQANPDRTRQWFDVSGHLFDMTINDPHQNEATARLAELAAELLLLHAEHTIGNETKRS